MKSKAVRPEDDLTSGEAPLSSSSLAMALCRLVMAHISALHWLRSCTSTCAPAPISAATTS